MWLTLLTSYGHAEVLYKLDSQICGFFKDYDQNTDANNRTYYGLGKDSRFTIIEDSSDRLIVKVDSIKPASIAYFAEYLRVSNVPCVQATEPGTYYIAKGEIYNYDYHPNFGSEFGFLYVPFKLRNFDKELTISNGSSVGGYIGWLLGGKAIDNPVLFVVSAGLALIPVSDINDPEPKSKQGFTAATGFIYRALPSFEIGFIFGWDWLGGSEAKTWKNEGQPWASISFGPNLTSHSAKTAP